MPEGNPRAIYRAHHAVTEFGIEPGDTVIVEPGNPSAPVQVVKLYDRSHLPSVFRHLDDFTLLDASGPGPFTPNGRPRLEVMK